MDNALGTEETELTNQSEEQTPSLSHGKEYVKLEPLSSESGAELPDAPIMDNDLGTIDHKPATFDVTMETTFSSDTELNNLPENQTLSPSLPGKVNNDVKVEYPDSDPQSTETYCGDEHYVPVAGYINIKPNVKYELDSNDEPPSFSHMDVSKYDDNVFDISKVKVEGSTMVEVQGDLKPLRYEVKENTLYESSTGDIDVATMLPKEHSGGLGEHCTTNNSSEIFPNILYKNCIVDSSESVLDENDTTVSTECVNAGDTNYIANSSELKVKDSSESVILGDPCSTEACTQDKDHPAATGKQSKPKECNICGKIFQNKSGLKYHRKSKHTFQRNWKCETCGKTFVTGGDLRRHIRIHTGERPYKCDLCEMAFKHRHNLQYHLQNTHGPEKEDFKCDLCDRKFNSHHYLCKHIETHKSCEFCEVCGKGYPDKTQLNRHSQTHKDTKERIKTNDYKCHLCGRNFDFNPRNLSKHVDTHDSCKFCDICGWGFASKKQLHRHYKKQKDTHYKCKHCTEVFGEMSELETHSELTHKDTTGKSVTCNVCGKTFTRSYNLKRHNKVHEEQE